MKCSENTPALPAALGVTARPGEEEEREPFPGAEGTLRTSVPPRRVESFPPELWERRGEEPSERGRTRRGASFLPRHGRRDEAPGPAPRLSTSARLPSPPAYGRSPAACPPAAKPPTPLPAPTVAALRPAAFPRSCRGLRSSRSPLRSCLGRKRPPCYFLPRKRLQAGADPPRKEAVAAAAAAGAGERLLRAGGARGRRRGGVSRSSKRAARPVLGAWGRGWRTRNARELCGAVGIKRASLSELARVCVPARSSLRGWLVPELGGSF